MFEPLRIVNADLAINRLASDCRPDQFVRELVVNAIEAIVRSGVGDTVVVDEDATYAGKFAVMDNGPGMTEEEMHEKLNLFAASADQRENHGVGAKIAALARSHQKQGVIYRTWQDGKSAMALLSYKPAGTEFVSLPDADNLKPKLIRGHGTVVTVMGHSTDDRTIDAPDGSLKLGGNWILQYLNSRFASFPSSTHVKVLDGKSSLRNAKGAEHYLGYCPDVKGRVALRKTGFEARWYLLPEAISGTSKNNPAYSKERRDLAQDTNLLGGRMILMPSSTDRNWTLPEYYDVQRCADFKTNILRSFGIRTGQNRVLIVLVPYEPELYSADLSRSHLEREMRGGKVPIDMDAIGEEFKQHLPKALRDYMDARDRATSKNRGDYLDQKLHEVHGYHLYPNPKGRVTQSTESLLEDVPKPHQAASISEGSEEEEETTTEERRTPKPQPPQTSHGPKSDGAVRKKMTNKRGLPRINEYEDADMPPEQFGRYDNHGDFRLTYNPNWIGWQGHTRALIRTSGFKDEAQIRGVITGRVLNGVKDAIYTQHELLQAKLISEQQFDEFTSPTALAAAASPRMFLLNSARIALGQQNKGNE